MSEIREPETDPDLFIRLRDGTIYGYTSLLAQRRDATIVDGYAAAQWFKSQGVENEVTRKFPDTAPLDAQMAARATIPAPVEPNRNVVKAELKRARAAKLEERARKLRRMEEADRQPQPVPKEPELPLEEPGVVLGQQDPLPLAMRELLGDVSERS